VRAAQLGKVDQSAAIADFLVTAIQLDQLASIRIAVVIKVLGPQSLVLLGVDEILDFTWDPL